MRHILISEFQQRVKNINECSEQSTTLTGISASEVGKLLPLLPFRQILKKFEVLQCKQLILGGCY